MNRRFQSARRILAAWLRGVFQPGYVALLEDIIRHVDLHGAYKRGGFNKMTSKERAAFERVARNRPE